MEPKSGLGVSEIVFEDRDFPEIIVVDEDGREFHISSGRSGIQVRCTEGVLSISPNSSNLITVRNVPFTGE